MVYKQLFIAKILNGWRIRQSYKHMNSEIDLINFEFTIY